MADNRRYSPNISKEDQKALEATQGMLGKISATDKYLLENEVMQPAQPGMSTRDLQFGGRPGQLYRDPILFNGFNEKNPILDDDTVEQILKPHHDLMEEALKNAALDQRLQNSDPFDINPINRNIENSPQDIQDIITQPSRFQKLRQYLK